MCSYFQPDALKKQTRDYTHAHSFILACIATYSHTYIFWRKQYNTSNLQVHMLINRNTKHLKMKAHASDAHLHCGYLQCWLWCVQYHSNIIYRTEICIETISFASSSNFSNLLTVMSIWLQLSFVTVFPTGFLLLACNFVSRK